MSMVLPPPQTREFVDRLSSLATECRDELEQCSQSIQEIELLLNQTQLEVDRLSQRETQQNGRIREMESSLEAFSRADIRSTYLAAHDVQLRLFMMRNQLEALESRRDSIDTQQQRLRLLLNLAEINREYSSEAIATNQRTATLQGGTSLFGDSPVDMAPELIQARERERVRISKQLTDGPAQVLANLILRTEVVKRAAERAPETVAAEIADLREMAARSLLDVRRSIFEMRPLVLDELGLVPTLRRYATDFGRENGATVTINGPERDDSIAGHTRVGLFRLIQQAMIALVTPNVGTTVQCDIRFEEAQVVARLDAANVGPKTDNTVAHFVEDSYTLEAIDLIGGSIQYEPLTGGVRVTLVVPIGLQ